MKKIKELLDMAERLYELIELQDARIKGMQGADIAIKRMFGDKIPPDAPTARKLEIMHMARERLVQRFDKVVNELFIYKKALDV